MNYNPKLQRYRDALNNIDLAVTALATGLPDIKLRLDAAYHLHLIKLNVDDFPNELGIQENFKWVISQLTSAEIPENHKNDPLLGNIVYMSLYGKWRKSCCEIARGIVTIQAKLEILLKTYDDNPDWMNNK